MARLCAERGHELRYLGSLRGQEARLCESRGIPFEGFASEPVFSLLAPKGWVALSRLFRASGLARKSLMRSRPDAVFSTGGFSAAPVVRAARSLGIPYVLHEQNSIPGRSNRLFARGARAVATTFRQSAAHFPGCKVERTGLPVRKALRAAASAGRIAGAVPSVLVIGGSQGSAFLNESMPAAAAQLGGEVRFRHSAGPKHLAALEASLRSLQLGNRYEARAFYDEPNMAEAYKDASVVVARSGGTLAELAVFGLPSVLVPLPSAAANHQFFNAKEFADMGAAVIQNQADATPSSLAEALRFWLASPDRRQGAVIALAAWDVSDATERIVALIEETAA